LPPRAKKKKKGMIPSKLHYILMNKRQVGNIGKKRECYMKKNKITQW